MKKKMTYEEAKNLIDDITWKYSGNSITNETICKCRDKCREDLDKQIPKKTICEVVEIKTEKGKRYIHYLKCPNCKRNIDEENTVDFCTYCGQAIDCLTGIKSNYIQKSSIKGGANG